MKRWLIWLLAVLLVLSGCDAAPGKETTQPTAQPTKQETTAPAPSLYVTDSHIEKLTDGTVKVYAPEGAVTGAGFMGEDIVVFSVSEDGSATDVARISGEDGTVKATGKLNGWVDPVTGSVGMTENRIAYHDAEDNCYWILDEKFQPVDQVKLPEGVMDIPQLSSDLTTAYFNIGSEIRAMDLQSGIPRLVCQLNAESIWLDNLLFDDTIISGYVTDTDGNSYEEFFSAQTGQSLGEDENLITVDSWGDSYLVRRMDGTVIEALLGTKEGSLRRFDAGYAYADVYVMPGMNSLVELGCEDDTSTISVFEPEQGNRTANLTLEGVICIYSPVEDPSGRYIWFIATDPETGRDMLCRWDFAASGGADQIVRIGRRYTAEDPDTEGLAACELKAQELESKYGVEIWLTTEPVAPEDYSFTYEYQVSAFEDSLKALDRAMAKFPEGFLKRTADISNNGKIHISLVRSMEPATYNAPEVVDGLQYWIDGSAYIALAVSDTVEQNFYHELSHVLDTYVYSNSIHYDFWEDNNPEGFAYDESYTEYETHYDSPWLEGEDRAFIDAYSMTYAKEDRARFLEYAMMENNQDVFASGTMQAKLKQLCLGIREAFGWKKYEGTFIWEQYLSESLAYVKDK